MQLLVCTLALVGSVTFSIGALAQNAPGPNDTGGEVTPLMIPANPNAIKHSRPPATKEPKLSPKYGYEGPCGGSYICSDDSVIDCSPHGRPYEDYTGYCDCIRDSCP
jgi:hypothetical protein